MDYEPVNDPFLHIVQNPKNIGEAGGFQRGQEEVRKSDIEFTHVILWMMTAGLKQDPFIFYVLRDTCNEQFLKGLDWLKRIDPAKYHKRLQKVRGNRYKNEIFWRIVAGRFRGHEARNGSNKDEKRY